MRSPISCFYRAWLPRLANLCRRDSGSGPWRQALLILMAYTGVHVQGDQIAFDNFENVPLIPFDVANTPTFSDGTDWTNVIPGWVIEFGSNHVATTSVAYNGWVAMDVNSRSRQQGNQGSSIAPTGRSRMKLGGNPNNTALVADPDAWDDFPPAGKPSDGFNAYIRHTFDLTGPISTPSSSASIRIL